MTLHFLQYFPFFLATTWSNILFYYFDLYQVQFETSKKTTPFSLDISDNA